MKMQVKAAGRTAKTAAVIATIGICSIWANELSIADDCGPHLTISESGGCCPNYGNGGCDGYERDKIQWCEGSCPAGSSCKPDEEVYPYDVGTILHCDGGCIPQMFCEIWGSTTLWGWQLLACHCSLDA